MREKKKTEKNKKNKEKKLGFRRICANLGFALKFQWQLAPLRLALVPLFEILWIVCSFLSDSYLLYKVADMYEAGTPVEKIIPFVVVAYLAMGLTQAAYNAYYQLPLLTLNYRAWEKVNRLLYAKAADADLSCYENPAFYEKMSRALEVGCGAVTNPMYTLFSGMLWRFGTLFLTSFLVLTIDPVLIAFAAIPFLLGLLNNLRNKLSNEKEKESRKVWRRADYVRRIFYQTEYAKELRLGGMSLLMVGRLRAAYRAYKSVCRKYGTKVAAINWVSGMGVSVVTVLGAMAYAIFRVSRGEMTVASCIVVINSIAVVADHLQSLVESVAEAGKDAYKIEDLRTFLDYEPTIKDDTSLPAALPGELVVEDLTFRYEGADHDTLRGVNLRVAPGERIALVGQNGSGKTTLVKLLLRLYDPTSGCVKMSGEDVRNYSLSTYRDTFGCVFQDYKVLATTVRENILLGEHPENEDAVVTEALKQSGIYDKVMGFEKGIDTLLTREFDDKGENLSGGEAQKIALARIFAHPRPFAILDEPSSALDPIAEHQMFENMMAAAKDSAVIFISHRLASAVNADRIYMMADGQIVESGTHGELMAKNGRYAEMFRMQAANYRGQTGTADGEVSA